jgi:hypothetical protein
MGSRTLVDLWIEGRSRAIIITRHAIEGYLNLPPDRASILTEDDRREFVRTHLSLVAQAASERVRADPQAETVTIDAFQPDAASRSPAERRQTDRRKGDRRQRNVGPPGGVERRG